MPATPPTPISELTHANWDIVNGPVSIGESSDPSTRFADEVQLNDVPIPIVQMFAVKLNLLYYHENNERCLNVTANNCQILINGRVSHGS